MGASPGLDVANPWKLYVFPNSDGLVCSPSKAMVCSFVVFCSSLDVFNEEQKNRNEEDTLISKGVAKEST